MACLAWDERVREAMNHRRQHGEVMARRLGSEGEYLSRITQAGRAATGQAGRAAIGRPASGLDV